MEDRLPGLGYQFTGWTTCFRSGKLIMRITASAVDRIIRVRSLESFIVCTLRCGENIAFVT